MHQPILEFENIEQARVCLEEWKTRLFLDDWIIQLKLEEVNENLCANVSATQTLKTAIITVYKKGDNYDNESPMKYCAEKLVVHELCHIALQMPSADVSSVEQWIYDSTMHQRVEQMAKSLIMAKYGMGFDWFKNF